MKSINETFALTALATAMAAIYTQPVIAADEDLTSLTKPTSSLTVGVGHWNGEREQFGIFDDIRSDETILLLDGDIRQRDDATGTWMTGRFRDLGIDTRDAQLRYERQGDWGVGLEYYQIPRVAPYTVNTGMTGLGTEKQVVPFAGSGYVPGTGTDVVLETERKGLGLDFNKYLSPNLNFKAIFRNEEKEGDRHWGRGGAAEFAAEPIDSTIRQFDAMLEYAGKELQLTGGYYGSWYENNNSLVYTNGRDGGINRVYWLSLPLDNEAHQFYVNGGYNFTPTTRGTLRVSYTHATQDEHIPTSDIGAPYSNFPQAATAPTNLDGEINTTAVMLGLSARPLDKLSLVANLRYHNVDDRTSEWLVIDTGGGVHSTPWSYETTSGKLEGTYRLPAGYSLIGGVEHSHQNRSKPSFPNERWVPYQRELDETTYRVQLRKSLSETLNGSLAFLRSERDGSGSDTAVNADYPINPINLADRDRNRWRLTLDWAPMSNFGLQFNVEDSQDDYDVGDNLYGLDDGNARLYSLDADFVINEDWRLTAWASYDETEVSQIFHNRNSDLTDTGKSLGLGIDGRATARLKVGADLEWTRTNSEYDDSISAAYPSGMSPLPDIESTATKLGLFAEYAVQKNADLRVDLIYERWRTDDWTWEFSDGSPFIYTGGGDSDGTIVYADPKQSATFVGLSYRYRF